MSCLALLAVAGVVASGCGGGGLTASSSCRDYVNASRQDQDAAVGKLAQRFKAPSLVTPLGRPSVDYACVSAPDRTLGAVISRYGTAGANSGSAENSAAGSRTATPASPTPPADATPSSNLQNITQTTALLDGIPQSGKVLGSPSAKVTMIEFIDLQCPFCKQYTQTTFPQLVKDYVRTGKVKMQLETLAFLGPDSVKAGRAAAAAAEQNKLWQFADLMYNNQGTENSGYVTDTYLDSLFDGAGVAKATARAFMQLSASKQGVAGATRLGETYSVSQTPTFVAGPTAGKKRIITVTNTDPKSFAILSQLGG